jgi:hypothetical protein
MMQVNVKNAFNGIFSIIIFKRLCDVEEAFREHYPFYHVVLWCLFFFLLPP